MKITEERLLMYGFVRVKNSWPYENTPGKFNQKTFRKKVDKREDYGYYMFDIQIEINDLPESNPNSGVVSIYHEAHDCPAVPEDLWEKEKWTKEDHHRAQNYTIKIPEKIQSFAWYINTEERLKAVYEAITHTKLTLSLEGELEEALRNEDFERVIEIKKLLNEK